MRAKHEDIVGRYMYITYEDIEYRIYYEEAGNKDGIPLLCGHSASAQGNQYRLLLNDPEIAKDFYMIAYDLPYHGKSLPPYGHEWWKEQPYKQTTTSMCAWPNLICEALELENPVYMGMSISG
jgi:pimeloyl-ACP methyl ester carboxylesterase